METFKEIIASDRLVLVDFYATWCQPCQMMHPVLEQVKAVLGDRIRILKIDIDKQQDTAALYHIQSVPTLMLFHSGRLLMRRSGALTKADLLSALDPFLL